MAIQFKYKDDVWIFKNPDRGNQEKVEKKIVYGRSAAGKLFKYVKGVRIVGFSLHFSLFNEKEKTNFITFFDTVENNTFEYTDHHGNSYNCTLLTTENNFSEEDDEEDKMMSYHNGFLTTTRKNPYYSCSIELEVE